MSKFCRCFYFENNSNVITNPKCPKFEQDEDDEDFVICSHVLIEDSRGFCEINYTGNKEYQVLVTLQEYRTIKADSAEQAREKALVAYLNGDIELSTIPEFVCEECDIVEDKNA